MNMMAAGFKMTDNGLTFWLCHDWYHSTPGGRANLDSFVNPVKVALAVRGVPLQLLTADGEHRNFRHGQLHPTSVKQLANNVSDQWQLIMAQIKAKAAELCPNKGCTVWKNGTKAQKRHARMFLARLHLGLVPLAPLVKDTTSETLIGAHRLHPPATRSESQLGSLFEKQSSEVLDAVKEALHCHQTRLVDPHDSIPPFVCGEAALLANGIECAYDGYAAPNMPTARPRNALALINRNFVAVAAPRDAQEPFWLVATTSDEDESGDIGIQYLEALSSEEIYTPSTVFLLLNAREHRVHQDAIIGSVDAKVIDGYMVQIRRSSMVRNWYGYEELCRSELATYILDSIQGEPMSLTIRGEGLVEERTFSLPPLVQTHKWDRTARRMREDEDDSDSEPEHDSNSDSNSDSNEDSNSNSEDDSNLEPEHEGSSSGVGASMINGRLGLGTRCALFGDR